MVLNGINHLDILLLLHRLLLKSMLIIRLIILIELWIFYMIPAKTFYFDFIINHFFKHIKTESQQFYRNDNKNQQDQLFLDFKYFIKQIMQNKMNQSIRVQQKFSPYLNSNVHLLKNKLQNENPKIRNQIKTKAIPHSLHSKSFSQSFLEVNNLKKINQKMKNDDNKNHKQISKSLKTKSHHMSDNQILQKQNQSKRNGLLLTQINNQLGKKTYNTKNHNYNVNSSYSNNFRHTGYTQKNKQPKTVLKLVGSSSNKHKSQSNLQLYSSKPNKKINQTLYIPKVNQNLTIRQMNKSQLQIKNNNQTNKISKYINSDQFMLEKKRISEHLDFNLDKGYKNIQQTKKQRKQQSQSYEQRKPQKTFQLGRQLSKGKQPYPQINQKIKQNELKSKQQNLQRQNNRLILNYSFRTRKGCNTSNPSKPNQDSILIKQNISKRDLHMICVADGHGQNGHHVSQFIIKSLSKLFSQKVNQIISSTVLGDKIDVSLIIPKIYDTVQNQLTCSEVNSATSGSTMVNVIIQKDQVLCANVGDSRAILARQIDKKSWELIYLSQDHKPQLEHQRKRILKAGGKIHAFKGENGQNLGPQRVWLPNQNIQGLAMSRSFGDNISKTVGVIHKPQMIKVKIDQRDKFILVASDGVWQFIQNQQILQLIAPYYKQNKLQQACDALLKLAYQRWTRDDDSVVDDISFVLVFFNY